MVGSLPKIDQTRAATTTTFAKTGFCSPILFYIVRRRRGRLLGRATTDTIGRKLSLLSWTDQTVDVASHDKQAQKSTRWDAVMMRRRWLVAGWPRWWWCWSTGREYIVYTCAVVECNYDTSTTAIYEWRSAAWLWGRVKWSDPIYYYCCFAFFIFSFWRRRRRASWQGDPFANNYYRGMVSFVIKTPEQQLKQSESIQGPDKDRKEIELWGCLWMRLFY